MKAKAEFISLVAYEPKVQKALYNEPATRININIYKYIKNQTVLQNCVFVFLCTYNFLLSRRRM